MPIEGKGDIASALIDRPDRLFFARGVSNSQETRETEYDREISTLMQMDKSQHLVYFSSLSIYYSHNRYSLHKRVMEEIVKAQFPHNTIVRLGNITWGDNPHTIINFMRNRKKEGLPLEVQDTYRYVIDKDEFQHWMEMIPDWNCEMNLPGRRMKVQQIVDEFVK